MHRYMLQWALSKPELRQRMSFIAGPRQVGKTTAIEHFLADKKCSQLYFNWDTPSVKRRLAKDPLFFLEDAPIGTPDSWIAFDEIHKYPGWKNLLKGYYDELRNHFRFIITGSARLDMFRQSGDSLVGRYFLFRMLPLGWRDILESKTPYSKLWNPLLPIENFFAAKPEVFDTIQQLIHMAGFPEPFSAGTEDFCTKWREDHVSLILREDLRDLTRITQLNKLETLLYLLPATVGSPLSINSLKGTLECNHESVVTWLEAMKKVYLVFSLSPWTKRVARSILKEKKYYFWDWGMVTDKGQRFENFMAVMLSRAVAAWNEWGKGVFKLHYLRTKDDREVDFVISNRNNVVLLVECKSADTNLSLHLQFFQAQLGHPPAVQVVNRSGVATLKDKNTWVLGVDRFLSMLA